MRRRGARIVRLGRYRGRFALRRGTFGHGSLGRLAKNQAGPHEQTRQRGEKSISHSNTCSILALVSPTASSWKSLPGEVVVPKSPRRRPGETYRHLTLLCMKACLARLCETRSAAPRWLLRILAEHGQALKLGDFRSDLVEGKVPRGFFGVEREATPTEVAPMARLAWFRPG